MSCKNSEPFIWRMPDGCTRIGWHRFFLMFFWNTAFFRAHTGATGERLYGISLRLFGRPPMSIIKVLI